LKIKSIEGPSRWIWGAPIFSALFIILLLIGILFTQQGSSVDGLTTDTGARFAAVVLAFVFLVPLSIRGLKMRVPNVILWIAGGMSLLVAGFLWLLVAIGQSNMAWSAYGGLQVLRARGTFQDLKYVLQWWDCGFCSPEEFIYGPALAWWKWMTFGVITAEWAPGLGLALAILLTLAFIEIGRMSGNQGKLTVVAVALSPAWLLLLDRANLDAFAILILVAGAILVHRKDQLWAWSLLALGIWIFGTWKFYPFALGLALIPVLRLRRGWLVIVGFLSASVSYVAIFQQELQSGIAGNERFNFILGDFPAYGRAMLLDRLDLSGILNSQALMWNLVIAGIVASAAIWGGVCAGRLYEASPGVTLMAAGGSSIFLISTLIGSYGYFYKGAFLIPLIPLLSIPMMRRQMRGDHFSRYTSIVALTLLVIALWSAYASILSSIAAFLVAGIALGASVVLAWRSIKAHRQRMLQHTSQVLAT